MLSGMCVEVCLPVVLSPTSNNTMKMNKNMNMMASRHHGQQQFLGKKRPRASASVTTSTSTSTTTDNNTKTINMQRSRRTRRVHFSSSSTELLSSSSSSPMPPITLIYIGRSGTYQDLINDVWYNKNELAVFTNEAREYVLEGLRLRGNNSNSNNGGGDEQQQRAQQSAKNSTSTTITSCECSRGYERYDLSRVQQKALTRKVILLACSQKVAINLSADEMAMIARKSSSYAVQEAFVTGFQDYCDVYHDLQQEANTNTTPKSIVVQSKQQQQNIAAEDDEDDASTIISTSSTSTSDTTSSTTATATTTISVNYDDVTPPVTPPSCKRLRRTF